MIKFNKSRRVKTGSVLTSKDSEVWFAIKARGMKNYDIKQFREYLNACAVEFLRPNKVVEDATNEGPETRSVKNGTSEIEKIAGAGKSKTGEKPS